MRDRPLGHSYALAHAICEIRIGSAGTLTMRWCAGPTPDQFYISACGWSTKLDQAQHILSAAITVVCSFVAEHLKNGR